MASYKDSILEFNKYMKSDKMSCIIYADMESLIKKKKINGCTNNPENFSKRRITEHISCGYSMSTIWAFNHVKKKLYIVEKLLKKGFLNLLRENTKNIIDYEKKKYVTVNKRRIKIASRYKSMLHLWKKKSGKSSLKL